MKSFVENLYNSNLIIFFRNLLKIKPLYFDLRKISNDSVSDAFLWRTDNNFKTIFRFSDILMTFYKIKNSWVEIEFYTKNNELIKKDKISNLDYSNELNIDEKYLNGIKDYGTFYIYHYTNEKIYEGNIIANRCYVGYSKNNNLYSFVHGNILANAKKINKNNKLNNKILKILPIQNQCYKLQKYFKNFDKNELFFSNPTSKDIYFSINSSNYVLKKNSCTIIELKNEEVIKIKSNCLFFRPIIFSYKDEYFDVHHG